MGVAAESGVNAQATKQPINCKLVAPRGPALLEVVPMLDRSSLLLLGRYGPGMHQVVCGNRAHGVCRH
jgi:hypothetical protein